VTSYPRFFYLFVKYNEGGLIDGREEKCCVPSFGPENLLSTLIDTFLFSNDTKFDDAERANINYLNSPLAKISSSLIYKEQISWTKTTQPKVHKYICIYVFVCMYTYTHICMHTYMYIYVYT
jgi:hypothetical protein